MSASILDPDNPYRYLELRGEVVNIVDDPDKAFINRLAKKYMDQDEYGFDEPGDERVVIHIAPKNVSYMG